MFSLNSRPRRWLTGVLLAAGLASWFQAAVAQPTPRLIPQLDLQLGHSHEVRALACSPNGTLVATSGSDEGVVKLWDQKT